MTFKNNRALLLCYFKLCASFHTHWWIQIWVAVRKRSIRVKIDRNFTDDPQKQEGISFLLLQALCIISYPLVNSNWSNSPETPNLGRIRWFLQPCDLEIWWMALKNNSALLLYATSSFVQHFIAIGKFKLELQSGNAQSGSSSTIFRAVWPWNWRMTFKNNRAPLLCYFKLYAAFHSHC